MKRTTFSSLWRTLLIAIVMLIGEGYMNHVHAQEKIKDGTITGSSQLPASNAILELESTNRGLLFPRVALQSTDQPAPLAAHVQGMTVFNTDSAGSGATAVSPGLYYNDGTQWVRVAQQGNSGWLIFGNANAAVNGTPAGNTDSQYVMGRVVVGGNTAYTVASALSNSSAIQQLAELTVAGGDAYINGITVGIGGGQSPSNTALGWQALYYNTVSGGIGGNGSYNTAVGNSVMQLNTTGSYNTAVGSIAMNGNTTGHDNTAVGSTAMYGNTTGYSNTAVGSGALSLPQNTGNYNTVLGSGAGNNITGGNSNIVIGTNANGFSSTGLPVPNPGGNYQLNIGNVIFGTGVDSVGNATTGAGNIGINVAVPTSSLQVAGTVSLPFITKNGNYTLSGKDFTVLFTPGAAAIATLPAPTGISGRMYRIVNSTGSSMTVTAASGTVILLGATFATGTSALFQTDGTNWYQVQ